MIDPEDALGWAVTAAIAGLATLVWIGVLYALISAFIHLII